MEDTGDEAEEGDNRIGAGDAGSEVEEDQDSSGNSNRDANR